MTTEPLDRLRAALLRVCFERYADRPIIQAACETAIGEYIAMRKAYGEIAAGVVASYSIQGRSISRRNLADLPIQEAYERLRTYFRDDELPDELPTSGVIGIDFTMGAL